MTVTRQGLLTLGVLCFTLLARPDSGDAQPGATTYNLHGGSITLPAGSPCHVVLRARQRGGSWRALPTLRGLRLAAIRECFGAPTRREGATVTYRFVNGGDCYWGTELRLTVRRRRVRRAEMRGYVTGMHCRLEM